MFGERRPAVGGQQQTRLDGGRLAEHVRWPAEVQVGTAEQHVEPQVIAGQQVVRERDRVRDVGVGSQRRDADLDRHDVTQRGEPGPVALRVANGDVGITGPIEGRIEFVVVEIAFGVEPPLAEIRGSGRRGRCFRASGRGTSPLPVVVVIGRPG